MYYHNHKLYEPEPEFSKYETYYLTSSDDSYSSVGAYGEPLQYHQEEWRDASHFFSMRDEEGDGFLSRAWYSNAPSNQQSYDAMMQPSRLTPTVVPGLMDVKSIILWWLLGRRFATSWL